MNAGRLSGMLDDIIEDIEENQEVTQGLEHMKAKGLEQLAHWNDEIAEKHDEYDKLCSAKEALFELAWYSTE